METIANQVPNTYTSASDRIRARVVQIIAGFTIVRLLLFSGFTIAANPAAVFVSVVLIIGILAIFIGLTLIDQVTLASFGLIALLLLSQFSPLVPDTLQVLVATLAVATLATNRRVFLGLSVLLFISTFFQMQTTLAANANPEQVIFALNLVTLQGLVVVAVRYYVNALQESATASERNADLLRTAAEVGQVTVGFTDLDQLMPRAVNFIRDRLGYYHVQIFLTSEDDRVARLRASTGEVGQQLLARRHYLDVGSNSVIGRVTHTGEPVIARDTDRAAVHYRNELLPNTRAELALPIRDGDQVIGALDVQSTQPDAFSAEDVRTLQILANLLAASIRNARLFEEQNRNMQENQRLYIEAEANLREIQRLNRQLTRQSWNQYVQEQVSEQTSIELNDHGQLNRDVAWTELLRQAAETRRPASAQQDGRNTFAVPIVLRGEVIGAMEIEPGVQQEEEDTVEIMRAVSERLAVSLDNARLFEEARETTLYEQRINDIVGRYQNINTVNELLQVTLEELGETLGAERGAIRLGRTQPDEAPSNTNGATSS